MKTLEEDLQILMDNPGVWQRYNCLYRWTEIKGALDLMGIRYGATSKLNASDPYQLVAFTEEIHYGM